MGGPYGDTRRDVSSIVGTGRELARQGGQRVTCYDHGEPMGWRHLNGFNKECVIVTALPRGKRQEDGPGYRVTPPWEGRGKPFTKEFEAFALTRMRAMPVKKAGAILGETDQRMGRVLHAPADWSEGVGGADEMNRKQGHNYITVFADLMEKRVRLGAEGQDAGVWELLAPELVAHNGHPQAV